MTYWFGTVCTTIWMHWPSTNLQASDLVNGKLMVWRARGDKLGRASGKVVWRGKNVDVPTARKEAWYIYAREVKRREAILI